VDEADLDAFVNWRPIGRDDLMRAEEQTRRCSALGRALWGRNAAHLQRQLLAPHPEIPVGFDLADFRVLLRNSQLIAVALRDPRRAWLLPSARSSASISVGTQQFTEWEARCEIVRRAIDYLESR
jgi:hypothetical protein